ncbi:AAA family ATPase [Flavilitoribacter nigricans]|uniref:ATPase n=1 Tax=Flavilitoribacter nigricans (strain ATCC 23147 / DSM 23189 / NBRC 102662 / NCIMB 1420 / SS-2) TaxID=1122177 RepID=A0A2D0NB80_FLAN2|nr:AAA family ATPase [Flavilitoribacter nigricans]PHN05764.1 ATPase [Flavilitoribacter nigricans DSM 23189 = NBRC 102662]
MTAFDYTYYGTKVKAGSLIEFLEYMFDINAKAAEAGKLQTPVCIWGLHGIGKTEIVRDLARRKDYGFSYIAPAQFEEMGDLLGMPTIDGDATVFRAPDWVPREEKPGILLIDDVNRADDRILRGIMQLLQNYELVSWSLPKGWQIVLTANPDGGDYSVTPLDDAMLTRMMHITLTFDEVEWARWAQASGIDSRGIDFVLTYPEMMQGQRTTPRTLVQFFQAIAPIEDLNQNLGLVKILGDSCLDAETVAAFIAFVQESLHKLPEPAELLAASSDTEFRKQLEPLIQEKPVRVDLLSTLAFRLFTFGTDPNGQAQAGQVENMKRFLLLDAIPADVRLGLARNLATTKLSVWQELLEDPDLMDLLLG